MKRNPNIEVFRCLLMFLIVLYHCAANGFYNFYRGDNPQCMMWLLFMGATMWHVDGFLSISGWFGINFTWRKFLSIWSQLAFYTALSVGWILLNRHSIRVKELIVDGGWFGGTYLMLMLFAPLLNEATDAAVRHGQVKKVWTLMATAITLSWAPVHLMSGCFPCGGVAFSFVLFIFIYVTARFMRLLEIQFKWKYMAYSALFYVLFVAAIGGGLCILRKLLHQPFDCRTLLWYTSYDAPHVWLFAMVVLLLFVQKVRVWSWLGKLCSFCGPSMFGIFLLHKDTTSFGRLLYFVPEEWMARAGLHPVLNVFLAGVFLFAFGLTVDLVRRGVYICIGFIGKTIVNWDKLKC